MRISSVFLRIAAVALALGLQAGRGAAQDPYAEYNRQRAYRHFLTSPSPYRTFSSMQNGQVWGYDTPLESARYWRTPGYYHERITPFGRSSYAVPPRIVGYTVRRPLVIVPLPPPPLYPPW
jgi:hypothetical protein